MDQTNKMKLLKMSKPIPTTEMERTEEALGLLSKLTDDDIPKLTTWEVEMVESIRQGRAVTRIRLKELREALERLHPTT